MLIGLFMGVLTFETGKDLMLEDGQSEFILMDVSFVMVFGKQSDVTTSTILYFICFAVSISACLSILVTAVVKHQEISYLYRFFIKSVRSQVIRTTWAQKIPFFLIIFVMTIIIPIQIPNLMMLSTRFFFTNSMYINSMQYIVYIILIKQFIASITSKLNCYLQSSSVISIEYLTMLEMDINQLLKVADIFNSTFSFSISMTLANYTITLICHIYVIHIILCENILMNQRITSLPTIGKHYFKR